MPDSAAPWIVARKAPLSRAFPIKNTGVALPFPSPGDFPNPGIEPESPQSVQLLSCVRLCDPLDCSMPGLPVHRQLPTSPELAGGFFTPSAAGETPSHCDQNRTQHGLRGSERHGSSGLISRPQPPCPSLCPWKAPGSLPQVLSRVPPPQGGLPPEPELRTPCPSALPRQLGVSELALHCLRLSSRALSRSPLPWMVLGWRGQRKPACPGCGRRA